MLIDALESGADTFTAEEINLATRSYSTDRDWNLRESRDLAARRHVAAPGARGADGPDDGARQIDARPAGSAEVPELVVKADALMRGGA